jgi:hypothetical protein
MFSTTEDPNENRINLTKLLRTMPTESMFQTRNRENAQSSTGPKTAEGKAMSSRNSLKHGMYSKIALLPDEDREEYLTYTTAMKADLKPAGELQYELAQTIADNFWRLRRFRIIETNRLQTLGESEFTIEVDPGLALAHGWAEDCDQGRSLDILSRHEQRVTNQNLKLITRLKDLQREERQESKSVAAAPTPSGFVPQYPKNAGQPKPKLPNVAPSQPIHHEEMPPTPTKKVAA